MPTDNILLITADDMRYDEMKYMPKTWALLGRTHGTEFTWAHCNIPLCSPTRAGIMTGQLSRYHNVLNNTNNLTSSTSVPLGQYQQSTFVAIHNHGYRVGHIGKFFTDLAGNAVKPGFDFWRALQNITPYGIYDSESYAVFDGTSTVTHSDYQDHYLTGQAIDFIRGSEPWCLWYCPTSDHWPWQSPPNHTLEWQYKDFPLAIESDVSDKPSWIQGLPALSSAEIQYIYEDERNRLRELLALDDSIAAMVNTIEATGQMDHTTIIFHSDNGNMMGEHRIAGASPESTVINKNVPYMAATHVPLLCRGPLFAAGNVATSPVSLSVDIVATMLARTGATAILPNQGGSNLVNIAVNPSTFTARKLLGYRDAGGDGLGFPTADFITDIQYRLIRHQGQSDPDKYELYDLVNDPNEYVNQAYNATGIWPALRSSMETSLNTLLA
jgi:N-acetylglucosamine-6-sulfatase